MIDHSWAAFHVYHHEDLDGVLCRLVAQAASELVDRGLIERFFFIRYRLGGPHVRLRIRPTRGRADEADASLIREIHRFLEHFPSSQSLDPAAVQRETNAMAAEELHETDLNVYPDNTCRREVFRPEIERYGGADRFLGSLEFFCLSSLEALRFLIAERQASRGRRFALQFRFLARQALGFAADPEEFLAILAYGPVTWGERFELAIEKADAAFVRQQQSFVRLLAHEIDQWVGGSLASPRDVVLGEAAARLSATLGSADFEMRRQVGTSQLHMTANRLGLLNPEEVYLGRILQRTASELRTSEPKVWARLEVRLAQSEPGDYRDLEALTSRETRRWAGEMRDALGATKRLPN